MPARAGPIVRETGWSTLALAAPPDSEAASALDRLATSVPETDAAAVVKPAARRDAMRRLAADLLPLLACVAVWLAGHAHHLPVVQRHLVHQAFDRVGAARLDLGRLDVPTRPARAVAPASGAVRHGLSRFVYEWTLGRAGEMSRHEKAEIARMRKELDATRVRAHRVIAALHARDVAQQQDLINRRAWSQWRARRLARTLNDAPPERISLVLAAAAGSACAADCFLQAGRPSPVRVASVD